jgi:hypothetical protein
MRRSLSLAVALAVVLHIAVSAQSPHGGPTAKPQPGPNVNTAAGIVADPLDPAAFLKSDLLLQRQNETVVAASSRNPDHLLAAANDYRFVDFPDDQHFGEQGFIARLIAKLFRRPSAPVPTRAAAAVGGWTGVYRSCDHGGTWIGGALPGSPLDQTPVSLASPMKQLSNLAEMQGAHAETTDPVILAGPSGRMHVVVLGFIRFPTGQVGESRVYYASYTDRNNREGGTCFNYDYAAEVDRSTRYIAPGATVPFIDKPSAAIDKDGTLFVSYTVFTDAEKSKIVVARSGTNGASWTRTSPLLSIPALKNHGSVTVVDPVSGEVFVAWRVFYENWPLMVISRSISGGRLFLPGTPISHLWPAKTFPQIIQQLKLARLQPFDQFNNPPNTPATARSLAFPHVVAGVIGGKTKLFAVWTERADVDPASPTYGLPSATGSPRIMLSMSSDGFTWTQRRAIDAGARTENSLQPGLGPMVTRPSGPQLQPVLNLSGTTNPQLLVAYYEARGEIEQPFATSFVSGIERQMDVRVARINPATGQLLAPSTQVSQYAVETNSSPGRLAETAPGYAAVNRGNLTMYSGGRNAFFGDYLSLASSSVFEWAAGAWRWATDPSSALTIWTDSRNARFPLNGSTQLPDINGDWAAYTPLRPALPATPPAACGNVGMRDSNPYFSEIGAIVAGSPQTFKPLTVQRAFVAYVSNRTGLDRSFRLQILDNEAGGLDGSFNQFAFGAAGDLRDIRVFANSTNVQTVWVQPSPANPRASVRVRVDEINTPGGAIVANGLKATIVLNPDPNNDALTPIPTLVPGFDGDPSGVIDHTELHNPQISTPQISTFTVKAPQISSPQISTPQISTPQISTPQISTPQISTPQISTPQISTPQISTPQISTPQIATVLEGENGTDVTSTVNNVGNTWTAYNVLLNVPNVDALLTSGNYQFQVIVTRTSLAQGFTPTPQGCVPAAVPQVQVLANIPVPATAVPQISTIRNPDIATPQIATPQIATFALGPVGGVAGQNDPGATEVYGAVLPDEVKVTLRAIRLTPFASGGPIFDPVGVVLKTQSQSTNVIAGVPEPDGSQPAVVKAGGVFVTEPSTAGASIPITPVVRVLVRDNTGAVVPGALVELSLSTNPSDANLTGNTATTGVDGIAQFPLLAVSQPGTGYVLQASSGSTILGFSVPFNIGGVVSFVVTSAADSGPGTLRQAILNANANAPSIDTITFNISGPTKITLATALPAISDAVHVDATTQPGFGANRVWVDGGGMPGAGFVVSAGGGGSSIRGLSITGFTAHGIRLLADGNLVSANLIGVMPTGASAPNGEGVWVDGTKNNVIGGPAAADRNVISGNAGHGVLITGGADATGNKVLGNYIGINLLGTAALPNGGAGVSLSAPSTIGGPGAGNVISGNNQGGIVVSADDSQSTIQGNFIGTNAAGTLAIPNLLDGIAISDAEFSLIGGTTPGAGNVISGNFGSGISLTNDASATKIQGNIIGLTAAGNARLGNGGVGVFVSSSPSAMVGGTASAARNIISGNASDGVTLNESNNSDIVGNYIGTDITGTVDLGNTLNGVFVDETSNSRVGGDVAGAGNLISGNGENGVFIDVDSDTITVAGNRIGTNAAGTAAIPNGHISGAPAFELVGAGIVVHGASHSIGLVEPLGGNLIAGNTTGISVNGTIGVQILNNTIGLNAAGTGVIANPKFGIFLVDATSTLIGGTAEFTRNVISGSVLQGIVVSGTGSTGVTVIGNYIGTNANGTAAAANGQQGILVQAGAAVAILNNVVSGNSNGGIRLETNGNGVRGNRIGTAADGTTALGNGAAGISIIGSSNVIGNGDNPNTIAFNGGVGVSISGGGSGNTVSENSIFSNSGLGIDLDADGVTANDPVDADSGANGLQNYPNLTSANSGGSISGVLASSVNGTFVLRFFSSAACDGSGNGEGRTWIGSTSVSTNANGSGPFSAEVGLLTVGEAVTATATDEAGNTSEFSACQTVLPSHDAAPVSGLAGGSSGSRLQPPAGILRERVGRVGVRAQLEK